MTTTLPSQEEIENFNVSKVLKGLSKIGDREGMSMLVKAHASIKDKSDWLSLNLQQLSNLSSLEIME